MREVPLIIFGAGKVGRALVQQLLEAAELHARRDGLAFSIVAWCDSGGAVVEERGLPAEILQAVMAAKAHGTPLAETEPGYRQDDLAAIVDIAGREGCIVVDVTATDATVPALELALRRGYAVATANKVPLVGPQSAFDTLVGSGRCRYESTVGSAVPIIAAATGLMRAADQVRVVRGALSGTLGFICTGLQAGQPLSALIHEAMRRGYTEPDPRMDLGGMDVARKALIMARTLGWRLELSDVEVRGLLPAEYLDPHGPEQSGTLHDWLARLPELDGHFAAVVAGAAAEGKVIRYVAELRDGHAAVGLQAVPADSALGQLRGNDNLVAFHTRYYPDTPLVLQGRGAGVDAAAAGVHADIVALASR
ncbi:MAG: homoserine dehydrogenase [Anaerolineae bacterium]|nr:homoserine dehydrogenase [Anaerolineae bacterium]